MKKILTLTFAILCSTICLLAANKFDLIIKTNSEKIEALIQEVSDTEIRYKKANNPTGPMFVVKLADISSIIYSNGEVQAIEHKAEPAAQPAQQPQQQPQQSYNYGNGGYNYNNGGYNNNNGYNNGYNNGGYNNGYNNGGYNNGYNNGFNDFSQGPMQRIRKDEYVIEGHLLKGKELNYFLQNNCPKAYKWHKTWQNYEIAGYVLLGAGAALAIVCGGVTAEATEAVWGCIPGVALVAGSIPLIVCGNVYKKRTHMVFNQYCAQPQAFQPELHLQSGPNGLGLALHF